MSILNKIWKFLASLVCRAPEAEFERPHLLLPETEEIYDRMMAEEMNSEKVARADRQARADKLREEANLLDRKAQYLDEMSSTSSACGAKKELDKREAKDCRKQAEKKRDEAGSLMAVGRSNWEINNTVTDELRQLETEKITKNGVVVMETALPVHNERTKHGYGSKPNVWDKRTRRVVRYCGRYFVVGTRMPAIVKNMGCTFEGRGGLPTVYLYELDGYYNRVVIDFVTDSVSQMTNEELKVIAG